MKYAFALFLLLAGCPTPPAPVPPPNPDASDAAPLPVADAGPTTPCEAACLNLQRFACREGFASDCPQAFAHIDGAKVIREPSGRPLSCMDVADASSAADLRGLGIRCAPPQ